MHIQSPSPWCPFGHNLPRRNQQGGYFSTHPQDPIPLGLWPTHVSVSAGWGPSPIGVRTHVAFTDLIRCSEAREAASVTFTNTGNGVWERHTSLAHNCLRSRRLYHAAPRAQDRNSPHGPTRSPDLSLPVLEHTHKCTCMHTHTKHSP